MVAFIKVALAFVIVSCAVTILTAFFAPRMGGIRYPAESNYVQTAHALGLANYSWAMDNDLNYPSGANSTEVCQKLLDGGYVTDPVLFYLPLPGKVRALPGHKLKPENVCWDFTSGANANDSPSLPLIFMTGYKVTYAPGGSAVPMVKPYPPYFAEIHSWREWLHPPGVGPPGVAVFYVANNTKFMPMDTNSGTIPQFVAPNIDLKGKTYRQLTPDGELP